MTTLDKKFITSVSIFAVLTVIYLSFPNKEASVFWAIYSFGLKDLFIVSLSLLFFGKNKIVDLFSIGVACYMSVPTLIRISCAYYSKMDYDIYRDILKDSGYSYFLLIVLLLISILIYYGCRNGR